MFIMYTWAQQESVLYREMSSNFDLPTNVSKIILKPYKNNYKENTLI